MIKQISNRIAKIEEGSPIVDTEKIGTYYTEQELLDRDKFHMYPKDFNMDYIDNRDE
jgi:hypothetical protein